MENGEKFHFWEDRWYNATPLCVTFPNIYNLAGTKGAKVADLWSFLGNHEAWNSNFVRT